MKKDTGRALDHPPSSPAEQLEQTPASGRRLRGFGHMRLVGIVVLTLVLAGVITSVAVLGGGGPEASDSVGALSDDLSPDPAQTIEPTPEPTPTPTSTPSASADAEPNPRPGAQLIDRAFVSVAVTEEGQPRELAEDTRISVSFHSFEDRVEIGFYAGCNGFGAEVEITAERLHLGLLDSTGMLCEPAKSEQDSWLRGFARSDPAWELSGDRLTLSNDTTVIELEEE